MYTFSEQEGIVLASLQRYLNIYFTGLVLAYFTYLVYVVTSVREVRKPVSAFLMASLLLCADLSGCRKLLSGEYVLESWAYRQPLQALADQLDIGGPIEGLFERGKVLLVHRQGTPHVPVNHFSYILYPYYSVPWECSYGSTALWEGDGYTRILTEAEFREHVSNLGVDYIAVSYADEDFVSCYAALFDHDIENGQVYRVASAGSLYELEEYSDEDE